jgi:outer membrane receptor for monomeric catechols
MRKCVPSLLALSFAASLPAMAQDTFEEEARQETVIVVGTVLYADRVNSLKAPTPIIDVPQSLSIVTADQILARGFDNIGDVINYTPGVNTSQGEGHRDAVVFRGIRSTADFFVDGIRDDIEYYRPLYNLEQVEILRGPNALLFGRGGTGGAPRRARSARRSQAMPPGSTHLVDSMRRSTAISRPMTKPHCASTRTLKVLRTIATFMMATITASTRQHGSL